MDDAKTLITSLPEPEHDAKATNNQIITSDCGATSSKKAWSGVKKLKGAVVQAQISKWVHRAMVLWGIAIGTMYLEARVRTAPSHCLLALRPWLETQPACAIVTIDCLKDSEYTGGAQDFEAVYSTLNAGSVEYVIFRNCPHVEFAPRILTFRNLFGVKVYNSTIQRWDLDAAVTSVAHPRVRFAFFVRTQFPDGTIPLGLRHNQYPPTLTDVEITISNNETLPSSLPWPPIMSIYIEFSQLEEFPMVLADLKPYAISLAFNQLQNITDALRSPNIVEFHFQGNPINELPAAGVDIVQLNAMSEPGFELVYLSLEYTNIRELPAWVTAEFIDQVQIYAAQSPICTRILQNASSPERELLLTERSWLVKVEEWCASDQGPVGMYPLGAETDNER